MRLTRVRHAERVTEGHCSVSVVSFFGGRYVTRALQGVLDILHVLRACQCPGQCMRTIGWLSETNEAPEGGLHCCYPFNHRPAFDMDIALYALRGQWTVPKYTEMGQTDFCMLGDRAIVPLSTSIIPPVAWSRNWGRQ